MNIGSLRLDLITTPRRRVSERLAYVISLANGLVDLISLNVANEQ